MGVPTPGFEYTCGARCDCSPTNATKMVKKAGRYQYLEVKDHRLKTSPTEGIHQVLTSIGLATFYIKRVGKLKLPYPLWFINIHKGTNLKEPISMHQNLQPANIMDTLQDVSRSTKGLTFTHNL